MAPSFYDFGEDGKLMGIWQEPVNPDAFTGVKADSNGDLHYYVNDVIQKGLGLIEVGDAKYYVRGNGLLAVGKYWIDASYKGCADMAPSFYDFGEDGKLVGLWTK